jgi:hypothetical protein
MTETEGYQMPGKEVSRAEAPGTADFHVDINTVPTLQLEEIARESEAALLARGVAYAKEYATIAHKSTVLAANLAVVSVALRVKHQDMLGRSGPYRQAISSIYRDAGIAHNNPLPGTVRWHVGNLLRRHMTPRELENHGLLPTAPLERQQDDRKAKAAIVVASRASDEAARSAERVDGETPVKATADQLKLGRVALNLVGQLSPEVIDGAMTDGQRAKLDEALAELQETIRGLRRHTRKRTSKA